MIVNEYDGTLRACRESAMTFHVMQSPQVFVHRFPFRVNKGETLLIPYRLHEWSDGRWRRVREGADRGTFRAELGPRFTTIITLDEHKPVPPGGHVRYEKTTFGGDQVIEIGPFAEAGEHFFSIQAIQESGVGSASHAFRFLVDDPSVIDKVEQLDDILVATGDGIRGFESSFGYRAEDIIAEEDGSLSNGSERFGPAKSGSSTYVAKLVTVADYRVTSEWSGADLKRVVVTIAEDTDADATDVDRQSDKGYVYKTCVNNYARMQYDKAYVDKAKLVTYPRQKESIAGAYELTSVCDVGGREVRLVDYLDVPPDEVPAAVKLAAAKNKLGLTRLMEAFKARHGGRKCTLRLPEGMTIVLDYHAVSADGRGIVAGTGGSDIIFPNEFTLDLNGGTICALQAWDLENVCGLVMFNTNYDTHVVNGAIRGIYQHYSHRVAGLSEFVHCTSIWGSRHCTFENMDISGSPGYEAYFGESKLKSLQKTGQPRYCPPFNRDGYVDYEGREHFAAVPSDERVLTLSHTEGSGNSTLAHRMPIHLPIEYVGGNILSLMSTAMSSGKQHRHCCREMFIHFYRGKYCGADGASENSYEFLCTRKVLQEYPVIIPQEAEFASLSAMGVKSTTTDGMNGMNVSAVEGRIYCEHKNYSYCCGFIGCRLHNNRTSLFDNNYCCQSIVEHCYIWDGGSGRAVNDGGWSNQGYLVDIEDGANFNCEMYVHDVEVIYGAKSFNVHFSKNLCFTDTRGFKLKLQKGQFGALIDGHSGDLEESHGFAAPEKYQAIRNSYLPVVANEWQHTRGSATKELDVEDSVVGLIIDSDGQVYLRRCKREQTE